MIDQQKVIQLKEKQDQLIELQEVFSKRTEEFEEVNKMLIRSIQEKSDEFGNIKDDLKVEAIEEYESTLAKQLFGGIGIRVSRKVIYQEDEAMIWAEESMPIAVKKVLDKKQFESYAKANELDFVNKEDVISVTFPKVLKV